MALAHDALSQSAAELAAATTQSVTHTPVGTPNGVVVRIVQNLAGDQISGVTYGGVAMTRVALVNGTANAEPGMVYFYFLGSGIPTGAQPVVMTSTGTAPKWMVTDTITGPGRFTSARLVTSAVNTSLANPVLDTGAATQVGGMGYYAAHSGADAVPTVFNGTNEATHDYGTASSVWNRNAIGAADLGSCGYTQAADDVAHGYVLVSEPSLVFAPRGSRNVLTRR